MTEPPSSDEQEARTERHLAFLDTLIAHGMDLANRVHHQATTPVELASGPAEPDSAPAQPGPAQAGHSTTPPITPETIALFDQISRAVRRAILVARKLAEPLPLAAPATPVPDRVAARKRIIREVEDAIHRKSGRADFDTLQAELHERVESVDLDEDIGNRPVHEIIAEICRDLGVAGDWDASRFKRRTPEDIESLCARAARPTTPSETPQPTPGPDRPRSIQTTHQPPVSDAEAVSMMLPDRRATEKPDARPPRP